MAPSEMSVQDDSGTVHCRMVNSKLPVDVCDQEQGQPECSGCTAASRRCLACKRACGIVDAINGWCAKCVEKKGGSALRIAPNEGTHEQQLVTALDRVRGVGATVERLPTMPTPQDPRTRADLAPSPLLNDPAALYQLLMEHGVERDGIWKVSAPQTILVRRCHLLLSEAAQVLATLAEQRFLQGSLPWLEIVLLKTDGIQEILHRLHTPRAMYIAADQGSRLPHGFVRESATMQTESATLGQPTRHRPPMRTAMPSFGRGMSRRPTASPNDVYAYLAQKSHDVRGERLVGGAIPLLQIRYGIKPDQAAQILTQLLNDGRIAQRDGWRTVALQGDQTASTPEVSAPVATPTAPPAPRPATAAMQLPKPEKAVQPAAAASVAQPKPQVPSTVDDKLLSRIEALEKQLAQVGEKGTASKTSESSPPATSIAEAEKESADVIQIITAQGFFVLAREFWGIPNACAELFEVSVEEFLGRVRDASVRTKQGRDMRGRVQTCYCVEDARRLFEPALLLKPHLRPDGTCLIDREPWAPLSVLIDLLSLSEQAIKTRITSDVRRAFLPSKDGGLVTYYAVEDVRNVCAEILTLPVTENGWLVSDGQNYATFDVLLTSCRETFAIETDWLRSLLKRHGRVIRRLKTRSHDGDVATAYCASDVARVFIETVMPNIRQR